MLFSAKSPEIQPSNGASLTPLPADGFRIHFDDPSSPRIESDSPAGRRYAENLLEDLKTSGNLPEKPTVFEDAPLFRERGFMLDISRDRVPTMETLFRLIDCLERLRFNQLQLYTEHTFAFRNHPQVWEEASPITPDEIREIEAYCKDRYIELVPNQNCFGHMERWLKHPEYRHLAECPDGFEHPIAGRKETGTTLFPSPESEALVEEMLSEVLPLYESGKANIGGDEPWELGQGRSRETAERIGKQEVYLGFLEKIFGITRKLGKEPVFWADIVLEHPELVPRLPGNVIPAIWGYHPSHPYPEQCRIIAEAGFRNRFQVVPGTNTWNSFTGRLNHAAENIRIAAREGFRFEARGLVLTCWGDGGHHQSSASLYPSLILAGRAGWRSDTGEENLAEAIDSLFYPGQASGNGEAICALGEIDDRLPYPNHNQSFLHRAFFAKRAFLREMVKSVSVQTLEETAAALFAVPTEDSAPDIHLSREMSRWAAERCLHAKREDADLSDELEAWLGQLHENFREVWLRDSRPGGLEDSLSRFPIGES